MEFLDRATSRKKLLITTYYNVWRTTIAIKRLCVYGFAFCVNSNWLSVQAAKNQNSKRVVHSWLGKSFVDICKNL